MPSLKSLQKKYYKVLPSGELDILLAHATKRDKAFLYSHPDYRLSYISYFIFLYHVWQRRRGVPIAYLTRHKEFYGLDFYVNKHTLIPRPETELMVDEVVRLLATTPDSLQPTCLIDIGTGSGCIPIAIASGIRKSGLSRNLDTIFATDISAPALQVARKNARTQNVSIDFLHGNLLEPFLKKFNFKSSTTHLVVTANLPYGWKAWKNNSSAETRGLAFEPPTALFTHEHGLALIRQLLEQLTALHSSWTAFLEFDPRQTPALSNLITNILPTASFEIKKDLAGLDRLVIIRSENR